MKKPRHKDQPETPQGAALREVKLQALLFGGSSRLGTALPISSASDTIKWPREFGE